MGQYYILVNLDTKEYTYADWTGGKLGEIDSLDNMGLQIVMNLLSKNNPWYKTRIIWAGEYGEKGLFIEDINPDENIHHYAQSDFKQVTQLNSIESETNFIINKTKDQWLDFAKYKKNAKVHELVKHPLPILLADGNGEGYDGSDTKYIGTWVGDVIYTQKTKPTVGTEIRPLFREYSDEERNYIRRNGSSEGLDFYRHRQEELEFEERVRKEEQQIWENQGKQKLYSGSSALKLRKAELERELKEIEDQLEQI